MEEDGYLPQAAKAFVDHCKTKLGWSDLSKDVVMDVGCGDKVNFGRELLEKFPDVKIIAIDKDPIIVGKARSNVSEKIECVVANLEDRSTLQPYEGKMTKVGVCFVFQQIRNKQIAFENLYRLLKPGGEALIRFTIISHLYSWLTDMLKNPKWKRYYQGEYIADMYPKDVDPDFYIDMAESVGFCLVECFTEDRTIAFPSEEIYNMEALRVCQRFFNVPSRLLEEFKKDSLQLFLKTDKAGRIGNRSNVSTDLSLLLTKPA